MIHAWIVWDIAAAAVIVYNIYVCARRGLIRTIVNFFSYFIAAFSAKALNVPAAQLLYDHLVKDTLVLFIDKRLGETLNSGREAILHALNSLPRILHSYIPSVAELEKSGYLVMESSELAGALVEKTLKEPVLTLLQSLCFIVIFSFILFIARRFSRIFGGIYRIPVIGTLDTLSGGLIGALQAIIILLLTAFVLELAILLSGDELVWLNRTVLDATYIWRVFHSLMLP